MTLTEQFETAIRQMTEVFHHMSSKITTLEKELRELREYKDVSIVNKLTVQVDQLETENIQLKKRLTSQAQAQQAHTQSMYSMPSTGARPEIKERVRVSHPPASAPPASAPTPTAPPSEPASAPSVPSPSAPSVPAPSAPSTPSDDEGSLLPVVLESGQYFWEPETGNLYKTEQPTAEGLVGKIKTIKVRGTYYYQDTTDNNVYEYVKETGDVGVRCGKIVNGKFVKV